MAYQHQNHDARRQATRTARLTSRPARVAKPLAAEADVQFLRDQFRQILDLHAYGKGQRLDMPVLHQKLAHHVLAYASSHAGQAVVEQWAERTDLYIKKVNQFLDRQRPMTAEDCSTLVEAFSESIRSCTNGLIAAEAKARAAEIG